MGREKELTRSSSLIKLRKIHQLDLDSTCFSIAPEHEISKREMIIKQAAKTGFNVCVMCNHALLVIMFGEQGKLLKKLWIM